MVSESARSKLLAMLVEQLLVPTHMTMESDKQVIGHEMHRRRLLGKLEGMAKSMGLNIEDLK